MPRRECAGAPSPAREKMWRAMRMQRQFRTADLVALCTVPRKAVEKYLGALMRAGYVRVEAGGRGCRGQVYTLVKNTGPFAPRAGNRTGVTLDPNLEIASERERRARLIAEIQKCDARLKSLGAFVEKFEAGADPGALRAAATREGDRKGAALP